MDEDDVERLLLDALREERWHNYALGLVVRGMEMEDMVRRADAKQLEQQTKHYITEVMENRLEVKNPELEKLIEGIQEEAKQEYEKPD